MGFFDEVKEYLDRIDFDEVIEFLDKVIEEAQELKERILSIKNIFGE